MKALEKLNRAKKKKGKGGGGSNGRRACKTFFNGPVLVFQLLVYPLIGQFCQFLSTSAKRVICVNHDNQYYPENASRARFRGIQVMSHFARMSPAFSTTNVFYSFERLSYYTFKVFWRI